MATIYNPPGDIEQPSFDFKQMDTYKERCEQYIEKLKERVISQNKSPDKEGIGEVIRFPVADGYAEYMVASLKPVKLVHLPLYDAYEFQYANRLTASDVRQEITKQQRLRELFKKKD